MVTTIFDGQSFETFDKELTLQSIYSPGHTNDHISFALTSKTERFLISGDVILGTPSAVIEDLDIYLNTLLML